MKKTSFLTLIITLVIVLASPPVSFCQERAKTDPAASRFYQAKSSSPQSTDNKYLKRSKVYKTIAWVLLCGGAASVISGAAMDRGAFVEAGGWFNEPDRYENTEKKNSLKTIGILAMCGSIPLFVAGAKNRARGMFVSFRNLNSYQTRQQQLVRVPVPALQVTFGL